MAPLKHDEEARLSQDGKQKRKYLCILLIICALLVGLSVWIGIHFSGEEFEDLEEEDLSHGSSCNYDAESARQEFFRLALSSISRNASKTGEEINLKECPQSKLLVCTKETGTCACGNIIQEALEGPKRSLYLYEDGNCRLNTGTFCLPEEAVVFYETTTRQSNGVPDVKVVHLEFTCRKGTVCRIPNGGENCTAVALYRNEELKNAAFIHGDNINFQSLLTGRICTCQD